jgi:hypothetical protein
MYTFPCTCSNLDLAIDGFPLRRTRADSRMQRWICRWAARKHKLPCPHKWRPAQKPPVQTAGETSLAPAHCFISSFTDSFGGAGIFSPASAGIRDTSSARRPAPLPREFPTAKQIQSEIGSCPGRWCATYPFGCGTSTLRYAVVGHDPVDHIQHPIRGPDERFGRVDGVFHVRDEREVVVVPDESIRSA